MWKATKKEYDLMGCLNGVFPFFVRFINIGYKEIGKSDPDELLNSSR